MDEFDGQYDKISVLFVGPYPDMASDPEEIMIDDIKRPGETEAYTIVHLPADFDGKTNVSVQVKSTPEQVVMGCSSGCLRDYTQTD